MTKPVAFAALFSMLLLGLASCEPSSKGPSNLPATKMKDQATDANTVPEGAATITLGGGCFWCVEAVYQQLDGVHSATSGYMGGFVPNPTYQQVCNKNTGHVEVVQLVYDPEKIPLSDILAWFWELHDPTTKDRQGHDVGPQYRSVIFYHQDRQQKVAVASQAAAQDALYKDSPIVTEIKKATEFYPAEKEHQNYYFLNGQTDRYCRNVIEPKLKKLKLKTK